MTRRNLVLSIVAAVALAALLVWAFAPRPLEVEASEARVGRFEATIDEDARTRLTDRYVISAPLAGQLQRIELREGDDVAADQVVATLRPALPPLIDERTLRDMHHRKTGALLQASVLMGAACGTTTPTAWQALAEYGDAIGLAFQVVDDILDVTQESETLGKTAGKDATDNKPTYVTVLGLDAARRHAAELRDIALAALARSGLAQAAWLSLLADRIVERES